jgi:hypothetical protein
VIAAKQLVWTRFGEATMGLDVLCCVDKNVLAVEGAKSSDGVLLDKRQGAMPNGVGTPDQRK